MEWVLFGFVIASLLYLDLYYLNQKPDVIGPKQAIVQSLGWITVSCLFGLVVNQVTGLGPQWFTCYIVEKALSVDNLFVFLAIFSYFKVKPEFQHQILYGGILGALILRAICIAAGVALLNLFHPLIYVLASLLLFVAYKVTFQDQDSPDEFYRTSFALFLKQKFRFDFDDLPHAIGKFFVYKEDEGHYRVYGTRLLFVLLIIEFTDLLFAVDSIPAVVSICPTGFIAYTSNIFAILGLRSLYFCLSYLMGRLSLLKYGIGLILSLIALKMVLPDLLSITTWLEIVSGILSLSVVLSLIKGMKNG